MRRFLSVWLPRWPIERRRQNAPGQERALDQATDRQDGSLLEGVRAPFVLWATSQQGQRITATNAAADKLGFYAGMPLADARAIYPALKVDPADCEGDHAALKRLALWCQCYSPYTRIDPPDGIAIDSTGCAHLFGGEKAMLMEMAGRLTAFGLTARLAMAPTIGAAWAVARHGPGAITTLNHENLHSYLAPLPIAGLRLEAPIIAALSKLGLKQIRDVLGKPRAPLVARFGSALVERLDQAFGKEIESFSPASSLPSYRVQQRFVEPLLTIPAIECVVNSLASELAEILNKAGRGARKITLYLFRVDGWAQSFSVQTSALGLSRDSAHLGRLLCERLDKIKDETGFGFEAAALGAFSVEKYRSHQTVLKTEGARRENPDDMARLLDRLINRFGPENVTRFAPQASYVPERSVQSTTALRMVERHDWRAHISALQGGPMIGRPVLMFATPELVKTLAEVPDGPPIRFEWRRISHRITRADGPERIAPEWWRKADGQSPQTRDYYRVEDETGRRFWLYRDGLHERAEDRPHWFIHGVFA